MSDVFKGVQYIEPEEYFKRNSALVEPKGYLQFPQYIKDWLYHTYGDKGDCIVMKSPLHPLYTTDPLLVLEGSLTRTMTNLHMDGHFEVKPRYEVEHDPRYIQLIVSCFIITPVGNVIGVRNLRHPQIGGVLSIPQGHVEPVDNLPNKTLLKVLDENLSRELDEEIEFMLGDKATSFNIIDREFTGTGYYPASSPEHIFAFYTMDMRNSNLNIPLNIRGVEDYNMIEIYALDEIPSDGTVGDFMFNQYWNHSINSMIDNYKRKTGIGIYR